MQQANKNSPYRSYKQQSLKVIHEFFTQARGLLILRGQSDFLLSDTQKMLRTQAEERGWSIEKQEASQLNPEKWLQLCSARSLFDPESLAIVTEAQGKGEVAQLLSTIRSAESISNPVCLIWKGRELPVKVKKEAERLKALVLECDDPAPWEYLEFAQDLAKRNALPLQRDALDLLLEAIGHDCFRLSQEIGKLSLIFLAAKTALRSDDLRPYLGYLREDHIFKLDQLLCQDLIAEAQLLIIELLDRGESALGLLAVLALHCRKALQIQSGMKQGLNQFDLARNLRLPSAVVQLYGPYVQKRRSSAFQKALSLCQRADQHLKSRSEGHELCLALIVQELAIHHPNPESRSKNQASSVMSPG